MDSLTPGTLGVHDPTEQGSGDVMCAIADEPEDSGKGCGAGFPAVEKRVEGEEVHGAVIGVRRMACCS